jgi:hypothetical protein
VEVVVIESVVPESQLGLEWDSLGRRTRGAFAKQWRAGRKRAPCIGAAHGMRVQTSIWRTSCHVVHGTPAARNIANLAGCVNAIAVLLPLGAIS